MNDIRKRCEELAQVLDEWDSFELYVSKIESFARRIESAARIDEREKVLSLIEMKLLDGTEANLIRREAAQRTRELLAEVDSAFGKGSGK